MHLEACLPRRRCFWSLGASASETIFDAGLRKATVAQYTAQFNADVAAIEQTVLTAFQQVEDYHRDAARDLAADRASAGGGNGRAAITSTSPRRATRPASIRT